MRAILPTLTIVAALTVVGAASGDGVIEINQARALAGGVTASDKPGFPVTIDTSGSYRLTSNLDVSTFIDYAIVIAAPRVTVDLNGFTVTGGVNAIFGGSNVDYITVKNGDVRGAKHAGIWLFGSDNMLDGVRVSESPIGLQVGSGTISRCTVDGATQGMIVGDGLVTGSVVRNSTYIGLNLGSAGYSTNALINNMTNVTGGVSLGGNSCDTKLCS